MEMQLILFLFYETVAMLSLNYKEGKGIKAKARKQAKIYP